MLRRIFIIFFLLILAYCSHAQLQANFSIDKPSGCSPLDVQFTNLTTGASSNATYEWSFGNGNSSNLKNPGASYIDEQNYTVTLTATDGGIKSTISKTITVYKRPVVKFNVSPAVGCVPLNANFTSTSSAGDGTISNYLWDFGDGNTLNSKDQSAVTHSYTVPQTPPLSLTVTNSFGCFATFNQPNLIRVYRQLQASFNASTNQLCAPGGSIQFTNTTTGDGTITYDWDFGDGERSTSESPSHTYNTKGSYFVKVTAKNDAGCSSTSRSVSINVGNFNVDFTAPAALCVNQTLNFSNRSTRPYDSAKWEVNNVRVAADAFGNLSYRFPATGTYTIKLTSYYNGCDPSVTKQVTIGNVPPLKGFLADNSGSCSMPVTFNFTDTTADAVKWQWYYLNNTTLFDTLKTVSRSYADSGSDRVGITVTNQYGCTASTYKTISFYSPNLAVIIKKSTSPVQSPNRGCPGLNVTFSTTPVGEITKFNWDFGDSSATSSRSEPSHIYNNHGSYGVKLTYETKNGCKGTISYDSIYINDIAPFDFGVSPDTVICGNSEVRFTPTVALPNRDYIWLVNNAMASYSLTPDPFVYHFQEQGLYTISLVMRSGNCRDTVTKVNYIRVLPPFPRIQQALNSCNGTRSLVTFTDSTHGTDNWLWEFGDGNTLSYKSFVKTLTHNYAATGNYKVKLTTTNGPCTVADSVNVSVLLKQKPLLNTNISMVCTSDSPLLTLFGYEPHPAPDSSQPYNITRLQFNDLTSSAATIDPGFWTTGFTARLGGLEPDKQSLRIITTSHYFNCEDTSNFVPFKTSGPIAAFTFNQVKCFNQTITLKDASRPARATPIVKWEWLFGDSTGITAGNGNSVSHRYSVPGTYQLRLRVTDTSGCSYETPEDSLHMLTLSGPVASFNVSAQDVLINTTVDFHNTSTYFDNSSLLWKFPGNILITDENPSFLFEREGDFPVSLVAKNAVTGCADTAQKIISVKRVQSIFTYNLSYTGQNNCPPVVVDFKSASVNAVKLRWTFGDGGEAGNDTTVSHVYSNAGVFTVKLYSYDAIGRMDSAWEQIEVKGPYATLSIDTLQGCRILPVNLSADTVNAVSFKWDFGDGTVISTSGTTAQHTYTTPGIYKPALILADVNGCTSTSELPAKIIIDSLSVNISALPDGFICDSSLVKFSSQVNSLSKDSLNASLTYLWTSSLHPGQTFNTNTALWFFNQYGVHDVKLQVTSPYGCKEEQVKQVDIKQGIKAAISAPSLLCVNDSGTFKGNSIPAGSNLQWQWSFGNNTTSTLQNPAPVKYTTAGTQDVWLAVSNGFCADTARSVVDVFAKPVVAITASKPYLCLGDTMQLTATGGIGIKWAPSPVSQANGGFSAVVKPSDTTVYTATAINDAGCSNATTFEVKVIKPFTLQVAPTAFACAGTTIQLNATGAKNYQWTGNMGFASNVANPRFIATSNDIIKLAADDGLNCFSDSATISLTVAALPTVNLGPDIKIVAGQEVTLTNAVSSDVTAWAWSPAQYLECSDCKTPVSKPLNDISYVLSVTNDKGCTASDTLKIQMICGRELVWIPSGFTPNGDNLNDRFTINGSGILIKHLAIFDRWGKVIFERKYLSPHDRNSSWDGTFNGQPMPSASYVYMLEVICNTGEPFTFKGTITLIR